MAVSVLDNGDGTAYISGASVTDNLDGTVFVMSPAVVLDNGDGTAYIREAVGSDGITATAQSDNVPPRVQLILSGIPGDATTVYRVDASGMQAPVRTFNPATSPGGTTAGYDYEAPFGQPVTYIAISASGHSYVSSVVTVSASSPWLLHPGIPALSMPLAGVTLGDETQDATQGVHVVIGRTDPIIRNDGVRHSPAFDLFTKSSTADAETALRRLLSDGSVLLLQVTYPYTTIADYYWVSIGVVTRTRITTDYGQPYYRWTLPCTTTSAPAGLLQAQWTCAGVVAAYATCTDVLATFATCTDLLIDYPIPA